MTTDAELGKELVEIAQARQFIRRCKPKTPHGNTIDERVRYLRSIGYGYFKAQAIAEVSKYLDAFTCEGEFFDFREVKC